MKRAREPNHPTNPRIKRKIRLVPKLGDANARYDAKNPSRVVLLFGRHKGRSMHEVAYGSEKFLPDPSYLIFIFEDGKDFSRSTREAARRTYWAWRNDRDKALEATQCGGYERVTARSEDDPVPDAPWDEVKAPSPP